MAATIPHTTSSEPGSPRAPARSFLRTAPGEARLPFGRQTVPAGQAVLVMVLVLAVGSLVNVQSLRAAAERQPFGPRRQVALLFVAPLDAVSQVLGLDEPRTLLDERLGRLPDEDAVEPAQVAAGGDAAAAGDALPADPDDPLAGQVAQPGHEGAPPVPTAGPAPGSRPFGAGDPLSVQVLGDSLTEQLGPALIEYGGERPTVDVVHEFEYSSGLTRPDFFDWPARVLEVADASDPDVFVLMFGANDAQDLRDADGRYIAFASPEWETEYRARVAALMEAAAVEGRTVVWVGQPLMRSTEFDQRMDYVSSLYAAEAARHRGVAYVDARPVFAAQGGGYSAYLPGPDGQLVNMRLGDGIHLTRPGADRLGAQVVAALEEQWGIAAAEREALADLPAAAVPSAPPAG